MIPCLYNKREHEIIDSEFIQWCKKQLPHDKVERDRLFMYRHKLHGTYVVARWAGEALGVFTDFLNLGKSLATVTPQMSVEFRHRMFAPMSAVEMGTAINQSNRDFNSIQQDKAEEAKDIIDRQMKEVE
ncbi:hypothetical protein LCGC14_1998020 [marine sediment metagenome]|uniref:Uncharacterized protein n=1 Tax=marine sediment metagenome TaxID=412755 RepID=A0A0F9HHJ3_9ZZZZ